MNSDMIIRLAQPTDHKQIIAVMPAWWGGRDLRHGLPRLFLDHFAATSFVMEFEGCMIGFLVGFLSPSNPQEGYVHFLGVDPVYHGQGIGRRLYRRFFEVCCQNGRSTVKACTALINKSSVAFHKKMGFSLVAGDGESGGIPFISDYNRPGDQMVAFIKKLD